MTTAQKIIKYFALLLAVLIVISVVCAVVNGLSFVANVFGGKEIEIGEMQEHTVEGDVHSLKLDIDAARIDIIKGDRLAVKSNIKDITVKNDSGTLVIKDRHFMAVYAGEAVVEITVPNGFVFEKVSLSTGANMLYAESIEANEVDIDFGAGTAEIKDLVAKKECDIDTGAGKVVIVGCDINDLDLDIGAGKFEMSGSLCGDCRIDMGVGGAEIELVGTIDDYRFDVHKGIGNITIDGNKVSDDQIVGGGECRVRISGGVGSADITFK